MRDSTPATPRVDMRAAHNSMASGIPSTEINTSANARALSSFSTRPGARAKSSSTALMPRSRSLVAPSSSGTGSGPSSKGDSPVTRNISREVTSRRASGANANQLATALAPSATSCSKLSSTSSIGPRASSAWAMRGTKSPAPARPTPNCAPTLAHSSSKLRAELRSTNQQPPGVPCSRSSSAHCNARRVLPMPGGPRIVTNRASLLQSRVLNAKSSSPRPTKLVTGLGIRGGEGAGIPGLVK